MEGTDHEQEHVRVPHYRRESDHRRVQSQGRESGRGSDIRILGQTVKLLAK